jgi:hypothetical protein
LCPFYCSVLERDSKSNKTEGQVGLISRSPNTEAGGIFSRSLSIQIEAPEPIYMDNRKTNTEAKRLTYKVS